MIETHAHIYDEQFNADRKQMLERAFNLGIQQIWMPNCSTETIQNMLAIEAQYPSQCFAMMGLHPCYVTADYKLELQQIKQQLAKRKFIMIGEIGMDYYWDTTYAQAQEDAFMQQLALAKAYYLPICIHARNSKNNNLNAVLRCIELIKAFNWPELRGIFHCFSGNLEEAEQVINLNFLLGIGGVATFKNGGLDAILPSISLKNIVLETDAPYLAPVPFRGKRNEVAYIDLVARRVAEIKNVSYQTVVEQCTENALKLISQYK